MKKIYTLILFAASLFFVGCTSDYHYANSFIKKFKQGKKTATEQIYVCLPKQVIHTNSSLNDIEDFAFLSITQQDSVIAALTQILDKVDDSIFLEQFNSSFLFTLSRIKVPIVLVDSPDELPKPDDNHFVIDIAQLEAEEFLQRSRSDFITRKGTYYSYDYDLRHFSTNVWLRIDAVDTSDVVYFKNEEVMDEFRGTVTSLKDGKATLKTDFRRINTNDAYRTARVLGRACATLYIEKMLTEYVCRQKGTNKTYFYYSAGTNSIEVIMPYQQGIKESFEKIQ